MKIVDKVAIVIACSGLFTLGITTGMSLESRVTNKVIANLKKDLGSTAASKDAWVAGQWSECLSALDNCYTAVENRTQCDQTTDFR